MCGGTALAGALSTKDFGLSPRVRGNHVEAAVNGTLNRSIPACAGEPEVFARRNIQMAVYPRVCGGTASACCCATLSEGLSPRVRGNRCECKYSIQYYGSIPACAGEPPIPASSLTQKRVYPRVCGGTHWGQVYGPNWKGLSPLCAGEPRPLQEPHGTLAVYPRVCGGTTFSVVKTSAPEGLSPRVRGNQG